jgi:hypothetical protein
VDEYVINFINDAGVYQQLTFRGVSEPVASGLATGLLAAGFQEVSLSAKEFVDRTIILADPTESGDSPQA